jgi:hypothetical protein
MRPAIHTAVTQGMRQERNERLGRQRTGQRLSNHSQKAPRRRQAQRLPRAVIGRDVPPIERGGDLTGQVSIGADKRGAGSVFGGLAQDPKAMAVASVCGLGALR